MPLLALPSVRQPPWMHSMNHRFPVSLITYTVVRFCTKRHRKCHNADVAQPTRAVNHAMDNRPHNFIHFIFFPFEYLASTLQWNSEINNELNLIFLQQKIAKQNEIPLKYRWLSAEAQILPYTCRQHLDKYYAWSRCSRMIPFMKLKLLCSSWRREGNRIIRRRYRVVRQSKWSRVQIQFNDCIENYCKRNVSSKNVGVTRTKFRNSDRMIRISPIGKMGFW